MDQDTRENGANTISRMMPFLEQRLYSQLTTKMLALHCNAVFGISIEMEVGGTLLAGVITGTAVNIPGLTKMHSIEITDPFAQGCMETRYAQINVRTTAIENIRMMITFLIEYRFTLFHFLLFYCYFLVTIIMMIYSSFNSLPYHPYSTYSDQNHG